MLPTTWGLTYLCNIHVIPQSITSLIVGGSAGAIVMLLSHIKTKKAEIAFKEKSAYEYYREFLEEEDEQVEIHLQRVKERMALKEDFHYMD